MTSGSGSGSGSDTDFVFNEMTYDDEMMEVELKEKKLMERFFYGTINRDYQNDDGTFYRLLGVDEPIASSRFEKMMVEFVTYFEKEYSRRSLNAYLLDHINMWQDLYNQLRERENKGYKSLEDFIE